MEDIELRLEGAVFRGGDMAGALEPAGNPRERWFTGAVRDYLDGSSTDVCVLYGLRRTGKTYAISQLVAGMDPSELAATAYMTLDGVEDATMDDLYHDLFALEAAGVRNVFVDEVTAIRDFARRSANLSNVFTTLKGMRVVLAGTDSLAFWLARNEKLYDRMLMLHSTAITYAEWSEVLQMHDFDDYVEFAGTMCPDSDEYRSRIPFKKPADTALYIDTAIAANLEHSVEQLRGRGVSRPLVELFEAGELRNVVNRVVQDDGHRFALETVRRVFESSDLEALSDFSAERVPEVFEAMVSDSFKSYDALGRLKEQLGIVEHVEAKVPVTEEHVRQVEQYLTALDVTMLYESVSIEPTGHATSSMEHLVTQPGLRMACAKELFGVLFPKNESGPFDGLVGTSRRQMRELAFANAKGRILEDIVIRDTLLACRGIDPDLSVAKLNGTTWTQDGRLRPFEVDMAVVDRSSDTCTLYEIKYAEAPKKLHAKHLKRGDVVAAVEKALEVEVTDRVVLYRGETAPEKPKVDGVRYENVCEYLVGLKGRLKRPFGRRDGTPGDPAPSTDIEKAKSSERDDTVRTRAVPRGRAAQSRPSSNRPRRRPRR